MKRLFSSIGRIENGRKPASEDDIRDANLADLMIAAQNGDRRSYARLLADCASLLRAGARGQGIEGDLADLFVQDTLISVHNARHTYDPSRSFVAWLTAISHCAAGDLRRRHRCRAERTSNNPVAFGRH